MTTVMATGQKRIPSEDQIPEAIDKCIADGIIKTASGAIVGSALSVVLFRICSIPPGLLDFVHFSRRLWPITLGVGIGLGMALSNCQNNLNKN